MSLKAGDLQHRVTIQQVTRTQDGTTGEMTDTWADWPEEGAKHWARIEPLSAKDFIAAQAAQSEVTARITLRYRSGLSPTMRIVHRSKTYKIAGILPDKESGLEYVTLPVSEGVSDG